jgi:hypothetical protein
MLSFSEKELRQHAAREAEAAANPKVEPHECHVTSNFFGIVSDRTEETCKCGQKWRMKSGWFFYKWQRI